ncbi:MAG: hypothetical protein ACLTAS_08660 [Butyribacter sp.]
MATMPPKSQEISRNSTESEHIKQDAEEYSRRRQSFEQTVAGKRKQKGKTAENSERRNVNNDELKNDEEGGGKGKYGKNSNGKNKKSSEKDKVKNLNPTEGGLFDIKI